MFFTAFLLVTVAFFAYSINGTDFTVVTFDDFDSDLNDIVMFGQTGWAVGDDGDAGCQRRSATATRSDGRGC